MEKQEFRAFLQSGRITQNDGEHYHFYDDETTVVYNGKYEEFTHLGGENFTDKQLEKLEGIILDFIKDQDSGIEHYQDDEPMSEDDKFKTFF